MRWLCGVVWRVTHRPVDTCVNPFVFKTPRNDHSTLSAPNSELKQTHIQHEQTHPKLWFVVV